MLLQIQLQVNIKNEQKKIIDLLKLILKLNF